MFESSAVPVCESSVAAVMCESSDVAAFETSIQKPSSQIKSIFYCSFKNRGLNKKNLVKIKFSYHLLRN